MTYLLGYLLYLVKSLLRESSSKEIYTTKSDQNDARIIVYLLF